jgi:hypothetical protein
MRDDSDAPRLDLTRQRVRIGATAEGKLVS